MRTNGIAFGCRFTRRNFLASAAGLSLWRPAIAKAQSSPPRRWVYVVDDFFDRSSGGWLPGFSDYTFTNPAENRLAEIRALPPELNRSGFAYYLQSRNTPDDTFMFLKKHVTVENGLAAGATYKVSFYIEVASNAPSGCVGIGGAPGESVAFKAGVTRVEPVPILEGERLTLNIDKGNQSNGGKDMTLAGHIANGVPCEQGPDVPYVLLQKRVDHPTPVTTGPQGDLWLIVGTDSGFEGTTGLYYAYIAALFTLQDGGTA